MIDLKYVVYSLNALFLLIVIYLSIRMTNAGVTYMWNPGDEDIKTAMKFSILKSIVVLLAITLFSIVFNLVAGTILVI